MTKEAVQRWLQVKWQRDLDPTLQNAYQAVFGSAEGQRVLQHWMDSIYCSVYEGTEIEQLWMHNGRRSFVHEILEIIDRASHPEKYEVKAETQEEL